MIERLRERCPCSSGDTLAECCGPVLGGTAAAATAERLMRSRFTAFARGDTAHLLRSWHPDTAPVSIDLDPRQRWFRLDIGATSKGGLFDDTGTVEFAAHYRHPDGAGVLRERSTFVRLDGHWVYLDGTVADVRAE